MNEFTALRNRARDKRDKAIAEARQEYESALVQIAALEQDLLGKVPTNHRSIASCVESVIPRDQPFNLTDLMTALEALDPRRNWRRRSVDSHIFRMRERGLVRRLKRATTHEGAVYVRSDSKVEARPLGDRTLMQVIEMVLTRPMTTTEVLVAVLEAGYASTMTREALRNHVARELNRGHFRKSGPKWTVGNS